MLNVLRREEKYPLNFQEAVQFSHRFSQLLSADEHSKNGSYMVRSLYFDTTEDKDFFDKITEQNVRKKIRIRIYSPDSETAKLEMKQKQGKYQRKRSLKISRKDAELIIGGQYSVLLDYKEDFAAELFSVMVNECYRPKSIVEYQRKAFMAKENNIRLTFDTDIKATESSVDLFSNNLPLYPVLSPDKAIFEVKYDKFMLGYISDIISNINRRSVSYSKYCLSRSLGYPLQI
ncbi:MAG: polyphosphate polymerase domain-containing protein [Bacillota bacterium]|nr:polyphosphate polymerase domain-containing protein [Bacillota bacterium]